VEGMGGTFDDTVIGEVQSGEVHRWWCGELIPVWAQTAPESRG
jgi:hypothetical protein